MIAEITVTAALLVAPVIDINETDYSRLAQVIECEAGADVYDGKLAIAQCVWNYCDLHDVTVGAALDALQCYTYDREITETSYTAIDDVFEANVRVTEEPILFWCTPAAAERGAWHETQTFVGQFGAHRFYKIKER